MVIIARPGIISRLDPASAIPPSVAPFVPVEAQVSAIEALHAWIETGRSGLGILAGEPGSGKSRMLEQLVLALAENEDRLIGVLPAGGGKRSDAAFLRQAIDAFGGSATGRTGLELIAEFRALLAEHRQDSVPAVLLIDDAEFGGSRLEILRSMLIANPADLEGHAPRLQMALFGAPGVVERINRRQRLSAMVGESQVLPPLSLSDLEMLVRRWHAAAGSNGPLRDIPSEALATMISAAQGNPGRALSIAEQAVHDAQRIGSVTVSQMLVQAVIDGSYFSPQKRSRRHHGASGPDEGIVQTSFDLPGMDRQPTDQGPS